MPDAPTLFDGATYSAELDGARLSNQLRAVERMLAGGAWYSLRELAKLTGYPEASVSARIRDLRKPRFGSRIIERRRAAGSPGTHEYRMDPFARAEPGDEPDPTLSHVVSLTGNGDGSVILVCRQCTWTHLLSHGHTVHDAVDALKRHPRTQP